MRAGHASLLAQYSTATPWALALAQGSPHGSNRDAQASKSWRICPQGLETAPGVGTSQSLQEGAKGCKHSILQSPSREGWSEWWQRDKGL
jgi:hypothetical protein